MLQFTSAVCSIFVHCVNEMINVIPEFSTWSAANIMFLLMIIWKKSTVGQLVDVPLLRELCLQANSLDSFTVSALTASICLPQGLCKGTVSGLWEIHPSRDPGIHCGRGILQLERARISSMGNRSTKYPSQIKSYLRIENKIKQLRYLCGNIYSETPHEQPPHEQPPLLWGHIFRHHYIFLTSHLNVNPWWTATPLTWSEASDFGSSHPWRAATQQLLEVASHGIHGWFGCGLTDIHVNHTSGQPWVHRPKACKGVDHT